MKRLSHNVETLMDALASNSGWINKREHKSSPLETKSTQVLLQPRNKSVKRAELKYA